MLLDTNPKVAHFGLPVFIPSHCLEVVNNYNKEKVIATNKVTPTTGDNSETMFIKRMNIYIYIITHMYLIY